MKIKDWIDAIRPKTLTAALIPIVAGTSLALSQGYHINWWIPVLALLASVFIQIGTNFINDAADFEKGADTSERLGPRRITQAGVATASQVKNFAVMAFAAAAVCGLPLVWMGGWIILLIGVFSLLAGYCYTAGPYPLAYHGLGDFFVLLFFGIIAVGGLYYLLTGNWGLSPVVLGTQVGLHAAVLISINNLRDIGGDLKIGKKTLCVRLGKDNSKLLIAFYCFAPFVLNFYWHKEATKLPAVLSLLALPFGLHLVLQIFKWEPSPIYNKLLAQGARLHLLFGLLFSVGLVFC